MRSPGAVKEKRLLLWRPATVLLHFMHERL
jgi:hypothetical protein